MTFAACNLSGTKSSYLAGRRRYNGGCTAYTKRPQAPICGPSGTGFAGSCRDIQTDTCLKPRLQPRQANQCHIIVNGECWVGKFAVWRFPVMQPSDIQVWEACPLPEHAWFVPDNCCICTKIGSGCVSLGGGDYDGDLLMFTSNPILLEFLDCTPSGDFREF